MKIAVLASGNGSNFEAIYEAIQNKLLEVELVCVCYDRKEAYVKQRAERLGVDAYYINPVQYNGEKSVYETALVELLTAKQIEVIVLAGYMRVVGPVLLRAFWQHIINIHPSYLPDFPGKQSIYDAFHARVPQTGVTVHLVDEGLDTGPILQQEKIDIERYDTLESLEMKIHQVEHRLYPLAIKNFIQQIIKNRGQT